MVNNINQHSSSDMTRESKTKQQFLAAAHWCAMYINVQDQDAFLIWFHCVFTLAPLPPNLPAMTFQECFAVVLL